MIGPMMMSLQTHAALTSFGDAERRQPSPHRHTVSDRDVVESAPAVSSLRQRLAQMHLAPAAQS
jgi:hypothetical protein